MANTDYRQIKEIKDSYEILDRKLADDDLADVRFDYPLDGEIRNLLNSIALSEQDEDEYKIFNYSETIKSLWGKLIEKSLNCLRFFDSREPFQKKPDKHPHACGLTGLKEYFKKYTEFEKTLYGSSSFYRDHVMHVFRVWILGVRLLLHDNCKYLDRIVVEQGYDVNVCEKLSIWTLISLTHDLGYPLQKAMEVVEKTKDMMYSFVSNPMVTMDLSFSGVQNSMNDFVLRFISSKMWEIDPESRKTKEYSKEKFQEELEMLNGMTDEERDKAIDEKRYVARMQPKYYFKFQKSLEHNQHGILSSLIIYKHLLYFLESDYSLNEDYMFDHEDSRQYYIRREILRAIASHTCHDVYQNDMLRFSFLLILCDDAQEWGRKSISELYVKKGNKYTFDAIDCRLEHNPYFCKFKDKYEVSEESVEMVLENFKRQSKTYVNIFRDGQDTVSRNFNFTRMVEVDVAGANNIQYLIKLEVTTVQQTKITITIIDGSSFRENDIMEKKARRIFKDNGCEKLDDNKILRIML